VHHRRSAFDLPLVGDLLLSPSSPRPTCVAPREQQCGVAADGVDAWLAAVNERLQSSADSTSLLVHVAALPREASALRHVLWPATCTRVVQRRAVEAAITAAVSDPLRLAGVLCCVVAAPVASSWWCRT
jgi:hypothetical protein